MLFITKYTKLKPFEPFTIVGGSPCQPFSTAGKRLGTNDPRGSLFIEFLHVIKVFEPRFFVMENVKGLLSTKFSSKNEVGQLNIFGQLEMDFENTEVSAFDVILNSFKSLTNQISLDGSPRRKLA